MTDELPSARVNDADRHRTVEFLRHHCADGLITLDEFSDRVGLVFAAATAGDLQRVTDDLPAVVASSVPATPSRGRRAVRWTVSLLGGSQQKGRWRVEGQTNAVSIMGGCQLDLRHAEVIGSEVTINALAIMGSVEVIVPEGIEVVVGGFSIMGGRSSKVKEAPVLPGSPLVRVRAFAVMGDVTVRSRPST